jgi:hypothetical protein
VPVAAWIGVGVVLLLGIPLTAAGLGGLSAGPHHAHPDALVASGTPAARATSTTTAPAPAATPATSIAALPATGETTALALLAELPIRGRAPMTGYARTADFGAAWLDVDRNGCDTRDDILARDLDAITRSGPCKVMSGTLVSPYTNGVIHFVRGVTTSAQVQIDHVVALGDAWQTGAQQLTQSQRISLANDPLNLLAADARSNEQKSDGDAATWLPAAKTFRCSYVARQISVKAGYRLWVTPAEHDAMARILAACPNQTAARSTFASASAAPVTVAVPAPSTPPTPAAPAAPAPGVVTPGAFCSVRGAHGVTAKGTAMVCSFTTGDARLRWRSAA